MTSKPLTCQGCKFYTYGAGFLQDTSPQRPITLIRYLLPNEHVQLERHFPANTSWGDETREFLLRVFNLSTNDELDKLIGYSYLIRCYLGNVKTSDTHIVDLEKKALSTLVHEVQVCKDKYDRNKYGLILMTYDFLDAIITPAYKSVLERVLQKAYRLHLKHRCTVGIYMGEKGLKFVLPNVTGGLNKWAGSLLVVE